MDYEHDVFISYRRLPIIQDWLGQNEFFHQLLVSYLALELQRTPRIFRDQVNLKAGDNWPRELEKALLKSRCLVPVATGDYFSSAWCTAEFEAFQDRAGIYQKALIVPVQWHDWEPSPAAAAAIQLADFRDVAVVGIRDDSQLRVPFQKQMKTYCASLARKIEQAPPFDPSWTVRIPDLDDVRQPTINHPRQPPT